MTSPASEFLNTLTRLSNDLEAIHSDLSPDSGTRFQKRIKSITSEMNDTFASHKNTPEPPPDSPSQTAARNSTQDSREKVSDHVSRKTPATKAAAASSTGKTVHTAPTQAATMTSGVVRAQPRVGNITAKLGEHGVGACEWWKVVTQQTKELTLAQQEDGAMVRMLRGYDFDDDQWKPVLEQMTRKLKICDPEMSRDSFAKGDNKKTLESKILYRHTALSTVSHVDCLDSYHRFLISLLATLKFASEWEELGQGEGGKKRIIAARQKMFFLDQKQKKPASDDLFTKAAKQWFQEHGEEFTEWSQENEHIVTARGKLLQAYKAFGVGVFLDPFWTQFNLSANKRTRLWKYVLIGTANDITQQRDTHTGKIMQSKISQIQPDVEKLRSRIVTAVDATLEDQIKDFIQKNPTSIPAHS